jgi:CRP-like cAMP-binding protein
MGFLLEVDVDEFLELMECETEARLRVAEIMARRRASAGDLGHNDEPKTAH